MKKQCRRDKKEKPQNSAQRRLTEGGKDSPCENLVSAHLKEKRLLPFDASRCRRKKPNVCLLSPVLTSSLPPLSPSAPPVLAVHPLPFTEPAGAPLHAAVQRQPQHPQSDKLPRLLQWGVLPAADRADQGDGQPRGQRPVAVCGQGPGVLHCGPKGKRLEPSLVLLFVLHLAI